MSECFDCPWRDVEGEQCPRECGIGDGPDLRDTDNSPRTSYEEALLREYFGEPNENGVYGAVDDDES
jgi:hypothetical protein